MNNKNLDIWKRVLEKYISGYSLPNTKVILNKESSYQIFEILVAETFAKIAPEWEWEATKASGDGGIDFLAKSKDQIITPFVQSQTNQLLLGQVKRRKSSYRYDRFCEDINSINELYVSTYLSQGYSLLELLFVVSTDSLNSIDTLRKRLANEQQSHKQILFSANLRAPIHIIDAQDLIQYWSLHFDFVRSLLSNAVDETDLVEFQNYLSTIKCDGINITISDTTHGRIGELYTKKITISVSKSNIPFQFFVKWSMNDETDSSIQLVTPYSLLEQRGMPVTVCGNYTFSITFRALKEGNFNLGELNIIAINQTTSIRSINLGNATFYRSLMPIYQIHPQHRVMKELDRILSNNSKFKVTTVRGIGGIGKSTLISEIVIQYSNKGVLCIDVQHNHSILHPDNIMLDVLLKLLISYTKKPLLACSYLEKIKWILGSTYIDSWTQSLELFLSNEDGYSIDIISSVIVSVLINFSVVQPIILWLSDLHWIDAQSTALLINCINLLENNNLYLSNNVSFILEGRSNELLEENHKYFCAEFWNNLTFKLNCYDFVLKPWEEKDCQDFINSILGISYHNFDEELYNNLVSYLLKYSAGCPMFIIEQIKLLIGHQKLFLNKNGMILIQDAQWDNILCSEILELIQNRVELFSQKFNQYADWITIYAQTSAHASDELKNYIIENIKRINHNADEIAAAYDMFNLQKSEIIFVHEYFSNEFAKRYIYDEAIISKAIIFLENNTERDVCDTICLILLMDMCRSIKKKEIVKIAKQLLNNNTKDHIVLPVSLIIHKYPNVVFNAVGINKLEITYNIGSIFMRLSNYTSCEEYFKKVLEMSYLSDNDYVSSQFYLLSCQQLANIYASKLNVKSAILFANKGLSFLSRIEQNNTKTNENLFKIKAMLKSRLAVCYLYSGDIEKALELHENLCKNPGTKDEYVLARINYEYYAICLHYDSKTAVKSLHDLYNKAKTIPQMYPTELYLIDVMRMAGSLSNCSSSEAAHIYDNSIGLSNILKYNKSTYIVAVNYIIIGVSSILKDNCVERAIPYFFSACKCALDIQREETLWKCYINLAQLYKHMGFNNNATNYAQKACVIIENTIKTNGQEYRENLISLFSEPLAILKNLCVLSNELDDALSSTIVKRQSLAVKWGKLTFFIMQ